jgi:hypothetical protein
LTGAVYTPNSEDDLQGNQAFASTTCTELIALKFVNKGTPDLDISGCSASGVLTGKIRTVSLGE